MYRTKQLVSSILPLTPSCRTEKLVAFLTRTCEAVRCLSAPPPPLTANALAAEPFLNGSSSTYVEEMYNAWLMDPKSVHSVSFYCL
jgi:2-oxoglutarate dehydrogenase E1 component